MYKLLGCTIRYCDPQDVENPDNHESVCITRSSYGSRECYEQKILDKIRYLIQWEGKVIVGVFETWDTL